MTMMMRTEIQARVLDNNPEVDYKKSRFSKAEAFFAGRREIAHFHNDHEIDIRLTKAAIKGLDFSDKRLNARGSASDWIEVTFKNPADIAFVVGLIERAVKLNENAADKSTSRLE